MRAVWPVLLVLLVLSTPAVAADARFGFWSKQLATAGDPRVRLQSAVGLGMLGDVAAVPILCKALSDKDDIVKIAAAKSLDAIGDFSAIGCLKAAATPTGGANAAITAAYKSLEAAKTNPPKLYVYVAPTENKADLDTDAMALVQDRLKARLGRMGAIFAPADEPKANATKVMKSKRLQGVMVMTTVEKYGSGLQLTLVGMSYPDKSIKGQITVKASAGKPADIIRALVPKAVEDAAETFEWVE
jgi:hypothetical protein